MPKETVRKVTIIAEVSIEIPIEDDQFLYDQSALIGWTIGPEMAKWDEIRVQKDMIVTADGQTFGSFQKTKIRPEEQK
jgi:hypothetical protein